MPSGHDKGNTYQMESMTNGHRDDNMPFHDNLGYTAEVVDANRHKANSALNHADFLGTNIIYGSHKPSFRVKPHASRVRLRKLRTDTFNFLEGKKTFRSKMWHRLV